MTVETVGEVAGRRFRRWRGVVLAVLALVILAVVLAALRPAKTGGYLSAESAGGDGARALVEILKQRGTPVAVARTASSAVAASRPDSVLVVVQSERLTAADLDSLASAPGDLLLVEPTRSALTRLAPGIERASAASGIAEPDCPLASAVGSVSFGDSHTYSAPEGAAKCYPAGDDKDPRLVQVTGAKTTTVLGSGTFMTNDSLAQEGNAALAINLVGARTQAVWLMPNLPTSDSAGDESLIDLVPTGVKLLLWQLVIAVGLLALWRARRLGGVVTERLPVVVRSAETVEGRSRLYRAARARDRAALALRESARERLVPLLGLPRTAASDPAKSAEIVTLVVSRSGLDEQTSAWALYGPDPVDDRELLQLTETLDDLERRVR